MKIEIEIDNKTLKAILDGKCVEGSLRQQLVVTNKASKIFFRAYNRKSRLRPKDKLIRRLEHGWVKESAMRIKVYESIDKDLGTARVMSVLDREVHEAKDALIERELDLIEFC